jgi:hypothetical protein
MRGAVSSFLLQNLFICRRPYKAQKPRGSTTFFKCKKKKANERKRKKIIQISITFPIEKSCFPKSLFVKISLNLIIFGV